MNIEQEIKDLAIQIQIDDCYGCNYNRPSQRDHTCLNTIDYEFAYYQAYNQIKRKYIDNPEVQLAFERFGYPYDGSSHD